MNTPNATATPAVADNPVAADLLRPHVVAVLPGWVFIHGSLKQINIALDDLETGGRAFVVNDLLSLTLTPLNTTRNDVTFSVPLFFMIKAGLDDAPDVRIGYTREALRAARALMHQIAKHGDGLKLAGAASGQVFINAFDANLDGLDVAFRLTAPADTFDYCADPVPAPGYVPPSAPTP